MNKSCHLIIVFASMLLISCQTLSEQELGRIDGTQIKPIVHTSFSGTRSTEETRSMMMKNEDGSLMLTCYAGPMSGMPSTKGYEVSTTSINSNGSRFTVDAFYDLEQDSEYEPHFLSDASCVKDGTTWRWENSDPRWKSDVDTYLWGKYIPSSADVAFTSTSMEQLTFTYSAPESDDNDFLNSTDIALSYNKERRTLNDDGTIAGGEASTVDITFNHAFAAVRFEMEPNGIADDVNIKSIRLKGIYGSGSCTVAGAGYGSASTALFNWTTTGAKRDFKQVLSTTKRSTDGRARLIAGDLSRGGSMEFFAIPQTLQNAQVEIVFAKRGFQQTRMVALQNVEWKAGYYYTYHISAIVHAPGDEIPINQNFNIKGFMNDKLHTRHIPEDGSFYEAMGVSIVGIEINHSYNDTAGKSTGYLYASSENGLLDTKGTSLDYDFLPVPSSINWPYSGGDGVMEHYEGYTLMASTGSTPTTCYYVYNVENYNYFSLTMFADGNANNARWLGTAIKAYVLELTGGNIEEE